MFYRVNPWCKHNSNSKFFLFSRVSYFFHILIINTYIQIFKFHNRLSFLINSVSQNKPTACSSSQLSYAEIKKKSTFYDETGIDNNNENIVIKCLDVITTDNSTPVAVMNYFTFQEFSLSIPFKGKN